MTLTFNPSDKSSSVTLSFSNLKGTSSSGSWVSARGTAPLASGKWYIEFCNFKLITVSSAMVGLMDPSGSLANYIGSSSHGIGLNSNAGLFTGGSSIYSSPVFHQSDIICMAVSTTANLVWFRINNGTWMPSGDPAAGTGGASISGLTAGSIYPAASWDDSGAVIEMNAGYDGQTYAPPSGYSAVDAAATPPAVVGQNMAEVIIGGQGPVRVYQNLAEVLIKNPYYGAIISNGHTVENHGWMRKRKQAPEFQAAARRRRMEVTSIAPAAPPIVPATGSTKSEKLALHFRKPRFRKPLDIRRTSSVAPSPPIAAAASGSKFARHAKFFTKKRWHYTPDDRRAALPATPVSSYDTLEPRKSEHFHKFFTRSYFPRQRDTRRYAIVPVANIALIDAEPNRKDIRIRDFFTARHRYRPVNKRLKAMYIDGHSETYVCVMT